MLRSGLFGIAVLVSLVAFSAAAWADSIKVTGSDLIGSRSTSTDVIAYDGWAAAKGGFKISWDIEFDDTDKIWDYSYTFTDAGGSSVSLTPDGSHWLLGVSPSITSSNYESLILDANATLVAPKTWGADSNSPNSTTPGANNGNPNLPVDFYAIKLDSGTGTGTDAIGGYTYTFSSYRNPIWGHFYMKDGVDGGTVATAWNSGLADSSGDITWPTSTTTDFSAWVPMPDTEGGPPQSIPLPAAAWQGIGVLCGMGFLALKRRRRLRAG